MVETDRTDSEIDNWADEYYRLDSELLSMRAKNCMSDDGENQVTDEENALETKMENINNSILSKIVDGAEIDVSVQFTDGSVQSEKSEFLTITAIAAGKIISRVLLSDWCEFGLANSQTNKFKI